DFWMLFGFKRSSCIRVLDGGIHFIFAWQTICYLRNSRPVDLMIIDPNDASRPSKIQNGGLEFELYGDAEIRYDFTSAKTELLSDLITMTDEEIRDDLRTTIYDTIRSTILKTPPDELIFKADPLELQNVVRRKLNAAHGIRDVRL